MTIDIPFVLNTEAFATYMIIEGVETGSRFDRLLSWIDEDLFSDSDLFVDGGDPGAFDRLLSWIDEEFFPDSDLFKD